MDGDLARGLKSLLEFPEGEGSIEEIFSTSFTVSKNPLVDNNSLATKESTYVDIIENGHDILVNRSNRQRFVDLFIQHALIKCCQDSISRYFQGLKVLFPLSIINICGHEELEHIICGSTDIGDLSELRIHTVYRGKFDDDHPVVNWFWVSLK